MPKLEADDELYFMRRVRETGGETRKVKWQGRNGAPDRLAGWPNGRYAFVELKHPDQPWGLQDHQAREHARMRSWGLEVRVIQGRDQIDAFISEMTREEHKEPGTYMAILTCPYCEETHRSGDGHPHWLQFLKERHKFI